MRCIKTSSSFLFLSTHSPKVLQKVGQKTLHLPSKKENVKVFQDTSFLCINSLKNQKMQQAAVAIIKLLMIYV